MALSRLAIVLLSALTSDGQASWTIPQLLLTTLARQCGSISAFGFRGFKILHSEGDAGDARFGAGA